jgi:hypothetical protein
MEQLQESERATPQETGLIRWIFRETLDSRVRYLRDIDGRPLGEQNAPELYQEVETELAQCPYRGSRHHHAKPMNVSALRQMTSHWPIILGGLREVHREFREGRATEPLTISDLYQMIGTGVLLPAYVTLRADDRRRDGEIPVWLGGIYKVLIGIYGSVGELMVGALLTGRNSDPIPPAEALLDYVESAKSLIGKREVCAGPPALIVRALRVILSGDADESVDTDPFHQIVKKGGLTGFSRVASDLLLLHFISVFRMRHRAFRLAALVPQPAVGNLKSSTVEDILSRLHLFTTEQSNPMANLCRRVEKIQGVNVNVLTAALATQVRTIEVEPFPRIPEPQDRETQIPLLRLLEEEEAASRAEEGTFRARGTELSRSILTALGYGVDTAEIEPQDVFYVSGKTLGELLREIRAEFFTSSAVQALEVNP